MASVGVLAPGALPPLALPLEERAGSCWGRDAGSEEPLAVEVVAARAHVAAARERAAADEPARTEDRCDDGSGSDGEAAKAHGYFQ